MNIKTVPQPPYCLDIAPCDICSFPMFRCCLYETIEEMKEAATKVIDSLTQEDFYGAFQNLLDGTTNALQPDISSKGTRVPCVY